MALGELIARLEAEGARRVAEVERGALEAAGALDAQAQRLCEETKVELLDRRRAQAAAEGQLALSERRAQVRRARLLAERALLDRVLGRARERLGLLLGTPEGARALGAELRSAYTYLEGQPARLRAGPSALRALAQLPGLTVVEAPTLGGQAVLESEDARVQIAVSLEAVLERQVPALSVELSGRLAQVLGASPGEART